ncbi:MAG TPA: sigma-70 family RNA polymerase sigma factor [bacterium]|nr:sigma-70 family RNA polymerase sigma factor [bacterium]
MGAPLDERKLVRRVLRGDERARAEFYRAYQRKLYGFCVYTLGANDPEIDDILQETFLAAFTKLPGFEFRSSLDTWLTQICIHKCYRHFRKRSRMVAQADEDLEGLLAPRAREAAQDARRAEEKAGQRALVARAMPLLGEACRRILDLRSREGASYIEIGRRLKVPLGTVMSRLARCTQTLRELVERLLREEGKP